MAETGRFVLLRNGGTHKSAKARDNLPKSLGQSHEKKKLSARSRRVCGRDAGLEARLGEAMGKVVETV